MVATSTQGTVSAEESIVDQDHANLPASLPLTVTDTVRTPQQVAPSPASTEYLLGRMLGGLSQTPLQKLLHNLDPWEQETWYTSLTPTDFPSMIASCIL